MALLPGRSLRLVRTARSVPVGLLGVAAGLVLASGAGAAAKPPVPSSALFSLSPLRAVALPAESATRYTVSLSGAPANNVPTFSWYLHLGGGLPRCNDAVLGGGRKLGPDEYVWVNQGSTFVWYHGSRGSYAADRSYGCDQAALGHAGYPGTVTLVVENEYQHCSASFAGTGVGARTTAGAAASCALGGYSLGASMLPVPAPLLALYRSFDAVLGGLIAQARRGTISAPTLTSALEALQRRQASAFVQLFPPVWGCGFDGLFDGVSVAKASLDAQALELGGGRRPSAASLRADGADMQTLARGLAACEQGPTSSGGAPRGVVAAVERLSSETAQLGGLKPTAAGLATLRMRLPAIASGLDSLIAERFPSVFGMRYIDLVERTLAVDRETGLAERAASARDGAGTVGALERILVPEQTTGTALRQQSRRVIAAENRNA